MRFLLPFILCCALLPAQAGQTRTLLVFGDSLSAGYGLAQESGWVSLLAARLKQEGRPWQVVNASQSGETTQGGATRIRAALAAHRPALVIVELGANDGLRGLPPKDTRLALERIVAACRASGAKVLLVGMRLPPNYGPAYTRAFEAVFAEVAKTRRTAFVPFLLEGIAADPRWFQPDGLHPTAAAQPRLLETVWRQLVPLL